MKQRAVTILWVRRDFRLQDNPALSAAIERGVVIPLFIWDDTAESSRGMGGRSKTWLRKSLESFSLSLGRLGARLVIRKGTHLRILREIIFETGASEVYWNRLLEPAEIELESHVRSTLEDAGYSCRAFDSHFLTLPWDIKNQQGGPFRIFTPFFNAVMKEYDHQPPLSSPERIDSPNFWPRSAPIKNLGLNGEEDEEWLELGEWRPGEEGASERLFHFLKDQVQVYKARRDRPDMDTTSKLSPHLHFGEITARTILHHLLTWVEARHPSELENDPAVFLNQIGWREFAHYLLYHFPHTTTEPLRTEFSRMSWIQNEEGMERCRLGETGYPIIDAGIRQMRATGWMHNRVRMIVASFLTKDLLIHWHEGAGWFLDYLVDADLANNTLGWQWTAGCGGDAAPYFRIFNPTIQGKSFDPNGSYVRRWVPELAKLPTTFIHRPWEASAEILAKAKLTLGKEYPHRLIDHEMARKRALAAYDVMRLERID